MMSEAMKFFGIVMVILVGAYVFIASQGGNMFGPYKSSHITIPAPAQGDSIQGGPSLSESVSLASSSR